MSDPQPRTGFLARFRRQNRAPITTPAQNERAAEQASSLANLARSNVDLGRNAAERIRDDLAAGRTSQDQVTAAAAERAAALDDAMHNLTVKSASPETTVRIAAEAYGEWQHTSPAVAERAVNLFAAAHEDAGVAAAAPLGEIAAAADSDRFHDRAVRGVEFGLRSSAATQDDLASGVVETADLEGYADGVRDHVNAAIDRLEHDPGSAAGAVELAANAYAEFGSATNAEALYAAAHETAGTTPTTPTAPLGDVLTGVIDRWSAADEAAAAEYRQLGREQAAAATDVDNPRTNTGELISLEVDQHVGQMAQTWIDLAREPGREVDAHSAYVALIAEVDNLHLGDTYLDPRAWLGTSDALPTPVPEAVVEQLGDLESHLQSLQDQVIIYSGNAGPEWFDGEEPTPADPARVAAAVAQAETVRAELHQHIDQHGLTGTQWDPRTVEPGASTPAAHDTSTGQQGRVSSYPMDVTSSLRTAAAAHTAPTMPSTGPSPQTSMTERGGGIER
ncbi:hypothetical protein [Curtobacterium flaccumfaciens]|uniref:hypothetical protein n=1 Tax=Curtobacterium flaccumfaciens TaxID=2035 RepID=UPI0016042694|nr:hypothetical protein [Curtobacterium flaccumfaciens]MBB1198638.1 hypothetical protein [Curtobacterium flaccumfaciens]